MSAPHAGLQEGPHDDAHTAPSDADDRRPWARPLQARSPHQRHRVATTLELFYDLVIVVAVAQAAHGLQHAWLEGHVLQGLHLYAMIFVGVWWGWMNFTWHASAYDSDDVLWRLLVFVQLCGALLFAAGIPHFVDGNLVIGTRGYVLLRLGLVGSWLRAARHDPPRRRCALRYAIGTSSVQVLWVLRLLLPAEFGVPAFWGLVLCELLVPVWAELAGPTTWHRHHIAERFGLLTIITLGESILAAVTAVQAATEAGDGFVVLLPYAIGGLLIVFSAWWLYFDKPGHLLLTSFRNAFLYGYGHFFVFASIAALGAGIAVNVEHARAHRHGAPVDEVATAHAHVSDVTIGYAIALPAAVYLVCIAVMYRAEDCRFCARFLTPLCVLAVLLTPWIGQPVLWTGVVMAGLLAYKVRDGVTAARSA